MESKTWLKGKKTLLLQLAIFIGSVLTIFAEQFQDLLEENPQLAGFVGLAIAMLGTIVRFYTDGPVSIPKRSDE